jgi:hypothetical protein
MSWIKYTPTEADTLLGPAELAVVSQHLSLDARGDILQSVISQVRGYCAARGALGPEGSIPPECRHALRSLYRYSLLSSLPTGSLLTDARQQEKTSAEAYLKAIGKGEVAVTRPTEAATPSTALNTAPGPTLHVPTRGGLHG